MGLRGLYGILRGLAPVSASRRFLFRNIIYLALLALLAGGRLSRLGRSVAITTNTDTITNTNTIATITTIPIILMPYVSLYHVATWARVSRFE